MKFLIEGGIVFMFPILILLILIIVLFIKGILNKNNDNSKIISLIGSIATFIMVWGFLGQIIGLFAAFNTIEIQGNISMRILAGGLKISFLPTIFAIITFLIGRIGIIVLTWMGKE